MKNDKRNLRLSLPQSGVNIKATPLLPYSKVRLQMKETNISVRKNGTMMLFTNSILLTLQRTERAASRMDTKWKRTGRAESWNKMMGNSLRLIQNVEYRIEGVYACH